MLGSRSLVVLATFFTVSAVALWTVCWSGLEGVDEELKGHTIAVFCFVWLLEVMMVKEEFLREREQARTCDKWDGGVAPVLTLRKIWITSKGEKKTSSCK